jgi:hypothetical protein
MPLQKTYMSEDNPTVATPHKGLVVDDIEQMLAGDENHPRQHLLQQISNKSDVLVHQLADFKNLIRDRKVVSFYETELTAVMKLPVRFHRRDSLSYCIS